jgi:Tfp pilus assembly protein PilZ
MHPFCAILGFPVFSTVIFCVGTRMLQKILKERRQFIRAVVDLDVLYAKRSTSGWLDVYTSKARNLCRKGMFLETDEILSAGQDIYLQFYLPNISMQFRVSGKVIWSKLDGIIRGMGVYFTDIGDKYEEMLEHYVLRKYDFKSPYPTLPR